MSESGIVTRLIGETDLDLLISADTTVFDEPIDPQLAKAYLAHPDYRIALATDGDRVVGMATGMFYFHPDKPLELFINEVGVAESHQRRGIASRLMELILEAGRARGAGSAWVATETDNDAANGLYTHMGSSGLGMVYYEFDLAAPTQEKPDQ